MNTTAMNAYKDTQKLVTITAEEMAKLKHDRETVLAEVFTTFGVVVFLAGFFLGLWVRTLWV